MLKNSLILFFLYIILLPISALGNDPTWEEIQNSNDYVYGLGSGVTPSRAMENANTLLLSSLPVKFGYLYDDLDVTTTRFEDQKEAISAIISTFGPEVQRATHTLKLPDGRVVAYLNINPESEDNDLINIMMERSDRMAQYIRDAYTAEKAGKLDFALRDYYWASLLLKTLPPIFIDDMISLEPDGEKINPTTWLPQRMSKIFSGLSTNVSSVDGDNAVLSFKYNGQPVTSLEYSCFDGSDFLHYSAKDGLGPITISPALSECPVKYEYEFFEQVRSHPEVDAAINIFNRVSYPESVTVLPIGKNGLAVSKEESKALKNFDKNVSKTSIVPMTDSEAKPYAEIVDKIIKAIKTRDYDAVKEDFTVFGFDCWSKLIKYGTARVISNPHPQFFRMGPDRVVCRSVPMTFSFKNGTKTFNEDVTFTFKVPDNKIEALAFSLGKEADRTVFRNDVWDDYAKMVVVNFLENYKTAYALKRLNYLESIFDDNAYILVGHTVQKIENKATDTGVPSLGEEITTYEQLSKNEYINNLKRSFDSKDYINIAFADNRVSKLGSGGDTYGITLKQEYSSNNYADKGYLILMVDLNDRDKPRITVRVWQSERDGNMTYGLDKDDPDYGLFDLNQLN